MNWYLTIRAFCVVTFIAAFIALLGACFAADSGSGGRGRVAIWLLVAAAFALIGCVLIPFGWTAEHP